MIKKTGLFAILSFTVICLYPFGFGGGESLSFAKNEYNLPTKPVLKPCVVYLKTGRTLNCDYAWRQGNTIFLVVQGKQIAVGYDVREIDMKRSFRQATVTTPKMPSKTLNKQALARELLEKSGMEAVIEELPKHYLSGLAENKGEMPPELFTALSSAGLKAYDPRKMKSRVLSNLQRDFDNQRMQVVMDWLNSPLGQKITALENAASTPEAAQEMIGYVKELQRRPASQSRLALVQRLDTATSSSEKSAEIILVTLLGTATAMDAILPKERQVGAARIRQQMELKRPEVLTGCRQMMRIGFLYTYRTLTDHELERYVTFAESEAGRNYHEKVFAAFKSAMAEAAVENGQAVVRILQDYTQKQGV